jgi:hypothetical protein
MEKPNENIPCKWRPTLKYICPLCKSPLSEKHYHRIIKEEEKKEKIKKGEFEKLRQQAENAKKAAQLSKMKEQKTRARTKQAVATAKSQAIQSERSKSVIRDKRLMSRIKKLEEEKKMLQKHTSPQEIGLADEGLLVKRLQKAFPNDRIEHAGKGGDVLHFVVFDSEDIGCIIYECKHTDRISVNHVAQTALAKKTRNANYGILVTTGTRKGFSGLDQESGIFVVAQAAVLTLSQICRESLISMAKAQLDAKEKAVAAKRLMNYITSPIFKTPLEEAISHTEKAHKNLFKEIKLHLGDWKERHQIYQTIYYDVSHVQKNIGRVLVGEEPLKLEKHKVEPLALPIKSENT